MDPPWLHGFHQPEGVQGWAIMLHAEGEAHATGPLHRRVSSPLRDGHDTRTAGPP
jgi:hypothetical protein